MLVDDQRTRLCGLVDVDVDVDVVKGSNSDAAVGGIVMIWEY